MLEEFVLFDDLLELWLFGVEFGLEDLYLLLELLDCGLIMILPLVQCVCEVLVTDIISHR